MSGYHNYSMSNNAVEAYGRGEKPLSKWTKSAILDAIENEGVDITPFKKLTANDLRDKFLIFSCWHHTSSHYNRTDFYELNVGELDRITHYWDKFEKRRAIDHCPVFQIVRATAKSLRGQTYILPNDTFSVLRTIDSGSRRNIDRDFQEISNMAYEVFEELNNAHPDWPLCLTEFDCAYTDEKGVFHGSVFKVIKSNKEAE